VCLCICVTKCTCVFVLQSVLVYLSYKVCLCICVTKCACVLVLQSVIHLFAALKNVGLEKKNCVYRFSYILIIVENKTN